MRSRREDQARGGPGEEKDIANRGGIMLLRLESRREFPLFDFTRPQAAYRQKPRDIHEEIRNQDMIAWIVGQDYSTLKTAGDEKYFSEWYCANNQGSRIESRRAARKVAR